MIISSFFQMLPILLAIAGGFLYEIGRAHV